MFKPRKALASVALALVSLSAVAGVTHAVAEPKEPSHPNGCLVEVVDANGNTVGYQVVPFGTRYGLFYCGRDGEWHFGWLVSEMVAPPTTGKPPIKAGGGLAATTGVRATSAQTVNGKRVLPRTAYLESDQVLKVRSA